MVEMTDMQFRGTSPRPDALRPPKGGAGRPAPAFPVLRAPSQGTAGPLRPAISTPPTSPAGMAPTQPGQASQVRQIPQQQMPILKADNQPSPSQFPTLGGTGLGTEGPIPLSGLGGLLERQLGSPTRFDQPAAKQTFDFLRGELEREKEEGLGRADVTAAQRGVFFGTPGTSARERLEGDFQRGLGTLASNLALEQARTGASDLNQAIANAQRFGETQLGADQFAGQFGLQTLGAGELGSPQSGPAISQLAGQPLPQLGPNPFDSLGGDLGSLIAARAKTAFGGIPGSARMSGGGGGSMSLPQIGQGSMPGVGGLPTSVSGRPLPNLNQFANFRVR